MMHLAFNVDRCAGEHCHDHVRIKCRRYLDKDIVGPETRTMDIRNSPISPCSYLVPMDGTANLVRYTELKK